MFMVTGNHEAYEMPYGISPRVEIGSWSFNLGGREMLGLDTEEYRQEVEKASQWVKGKGNAGIPADNNLTIYEAILAYGPTYAQIYSSQNFKNEQFDWFHTLFTPFSDATLFRTGGKWRRNTANTDSSGLGRQRELPESFRNKPSRSNG